LPSQLHMSAKIREGSGTPVHIICLLLRIAACRKKFLRVFLCSGSIEVLSDFLNRAVKAL